MIIRLVVSLSHTINVLYGRPTTITKRRSYQLNVAGFIQPTDSPTRDDSGQPTSSYGAAGEFAGRTKTGRCSGANTATQARDSTAAPGRDNASESRAATRTKRASGFTSAETGGATNRTASNRSTSAGSDGSDNPNGSTGADTNHIRVADDVR